MIRKNRQSIRLRGYDYAQFGAYFVTICTQHRQRLFGDVVDGVMVLNDAGKMIHRIWNDISIYYDGVYTDEFIIMPDHIHGIVVILPKGSHVGAIPPWLPTFDKPLSPVFDNPSLPIVHVLNACHTDTHICHTDTYICHTDTHIPRDKHDDQQWNKRCDKNQGDHGFMLDQQWNKRCDKNQGDYIFSNVGDHGGIAPTGMAHAVYSLSDVVHRFKTLTTKQYRDGVHHQNWPPFPGKLWQRNYYECIIRDDVALSNIRQYIANNPKNWHPPPP